MERQRGEVVTTGVPREYQEVLRSLDPVSGVTEVEAANLPDQVADRRPVCVVVGHDPPRVAAVDVVASVSASTPTLPIVVLANAEDDALAADVLSAGASDYVPHRRGTDALAGAVETAVETEFDRRELRRDRDLLDAILRNSPIEIAAKDTDARHVRSTKTVTFDEAEGKTETEYADDERMRAIERWDERFLETQETVVDELVQYGVKNNELDIMSSGWLRIWRYPWYENEQFRGLIGFTQDVTGYEETRRELEEKNKLLEQFASVVSHDLRNPLNVAEGYLEHARESGEESAFEEIERAHARMQEIIEDLVRLTRDRSDTASLASVDFAAAAREAWGTVETGDATLEIDADSERIVADDGLLQQIFENLYRNAVEHVGEEVTVTVGIDDRGFYVADDGPGVPEDVKRTINEEKFYAGGLGMNIARTIADRHDWEFRIAESTDGGALFSFLDCEVITNAGLRASARQDVELTEQAPIGKGVTGSAERVGTAWTVRGTGRNFWRNVNECYATYGTATGDAELVGTLTDFSAPRVESKAGLLVKADLDPESPHAFMGLRHDGQSEMLWQLERDAGTQSQLLQQDLEPPLWFRIRRIDDTVVVGISPEGEQWDSMGEQRVPLGDRPLYGLAVVSHEYEEEATAEFENVSLSEVAWE